MPTSQDLPDGAHWRRLLAGFRHLLGEITEDRVRELLGMMERVQLSRGDALFTEGSPSDGVFVLVSGRMRAVREEEDERPEILGEITAGESVGEMGFFTGEPRTATVYATRNCELIRFSNDDFRDLLQEHPDVATRVTRIVVDRLRLRNEPVALRPHREIAIVPLTPAPDVLEFADRLAASLRRYGTVQALTSAVVDSELGKPGASQAREGEEALSLVRWLNAQEAETDRVLYVADPEPGAWSRRCVARADQVVLVADATADPTPGPAEEDLLDLGPRVSAPRRTLVLVQPAGLELPRGTAAWLRPRDPDEHYHLRGLGDEELERLARYLSGRSVGVVLGGGGARGWAHIGVLRALEEAGVPVDRIGGTSMGAVVSAVFAMGRTDREMIQSARVAWLRLEPHKEYTLPVFSLLRGRKVARAMRMVYGDVQVEDLWTPYFSVSTNLTKARMRVHRRGSLADAVKASATLPGVLTPHIADGELLVDGGVLNNLPVDVMRELGAGRVVGVDVSGAQELNFTGRAFPSPWKVLRDRLLGRRPVRAPRLGEIVVRCTVIGSAHRVARAIRDADLYLRPPVQDIGLMDFELLDQAVEVGYTYARDRIREWWGEAGAEA